MSGKFSDPPSARLSAAQYLRASTNQQEYSIANQSAAIALYAAAHQIGIVRSFVDQGRTGTTIKGRRGLQELLRVVESGQADFELILVYDLSRWGRFVDVDEGAHYEYLCTCAGISIRYCAEEFENDASTASNLLKALKRTMASEYSRGLAINVLAGQTRLAQQGYRIGRAAYGLRRELLDKDGRIKRVLVPGDRKSLQTDRTILAPGNEKEIETIRRIFDLCTKHNKTSLEIAKTLNLEDRPFHARSWTKGAVDYLLENPAYMGSNVFCRRTTTLGHRRANPKPKWIIREDAFAKIIEPGQFQDAQKILAAHKERCTESSMLEALRKLWKEKGTLNAEIINAAKIVPVHTTFWRRFGGLLEAYRLIGFKFKRDSPHARAVYSCKTERAEFLRDFTAQVQAVGGTVTPGLHRSIRINDAITARIMFCRPRTKTGKRTFWPVILTQKKSRDIVIVVRLQPLTNSIVDYYVFPKDAGLRRQFRIYERDNPASIDQFQMVTLNLVTAALGRRPLAVS